MSQLPYRTIQYRETRAMSMQEVMICVHMYMYMHNCAVRSLCLDMLIDIKSRTATLLLSYSGLTGNH